MLALTGCFGFSGDGVRPDRLPSNISEPCPHPLSVIKAVRGSSVGSDEIRMGRLGDALIECAGEKQVAVDAYNKVTDVVSGS